MDAHEERSQKIADQLRAVLLALATAGIGAAYAISDRVHDRRLWIGAAAAFVVALVCIIRSWFVAKDRALQRRHAARSKSAMPAFEKWDRKSSWLWDTFSAWALIAGAALLAIGVWLG